MKKSNFPKDKTIVCNEKHTPEQHKEIMKMCIDYEVPVSGNLFGLESKENYYLFPFFLWNREEIHLCNNDRERDIEVSLSEFKAFIRGEGKLSVELEVGKWHYYDEFVASIYMVTKIENNNIYAYGFDYSGKYKNEELWYNTKHSDDKYLRKATSEEVAEALKKEALKRGFKGNIRVDLTKLGFTNNEILIGDEITWDGEYLNYGTKKTAIFNKGIWAEIIEQPKRVRPLFNANAIFWEKWKLEYAMKSWADFHNELDGFVPDWSDTHQEKHGLLFCKNKIKKDYYFDYNYFIFQISVSSKQRAEEMYNEFKDEIDGINW